MTAEKTRGAAYDHYGDAYRDWWAPIIAPSAVRLLDRVAPLIQADAAFELVDVGVGSGTLAIAALQRWPRATAVGVDPSQVMLDIADAEAARIGIAAGRLRTRVGEAGELPLEDASVDLALSSFVIQLVPSRVAAVREMRRVVRPGGMVAVVTWQADDEPFLPDDAVWDAFEELDIPAPPSEGDRCPYPSPAVAAAEFRRAGFHDVQATRAWLDHAFTPQGFLDVVEHWTEEDTFAELDEPTRDQLRRRILQRLERLAPAALRWRRPLVSVVGRRPA